MKLIIQSPSERYWKSSRRRYQKLKEGRKKKNVRVIRLKGPSSTSSKCCWRVKAVVVPKLCFRVFVAPPLQLLTKFKKAYVEKMNNLAGGVGCLNNESVFGGKRIPKARRQGEGGGGGVVYSSEEIEDRLVLEIYKALAASGRDISSLQMK